MKKRNVLAIVCLALVLVMSLVFVACNETTKYQVTFSGEGIETFTQTVEAGKTATATQPTRVGYEFNGWTLEGEDYDLSTPVDKDITLVAKWTAKTYTVTLDAGIGAPVQPNTKTVTFGEAFDFGSTSTSQNFLFGGWAVDGNKITNEAGVGLSVWNIDGDVTATAIWGGGSVKNGFEYTVLQDGTLSVSAQTGYNFGDVGQNAFVIPSSFEGKTVTKIGSMQALNVYEVKIPASITEIGASAFANNYYVEIVDLSAFGGRIGDMAFRNSAVKIIDLGSTTSIGAGAFENVEASIIVVPATVTSLGDGAFLSDNISEIGFMGDFPTLGENVFGTGSREDENLIVIAKKTSWDKLIEDAEADGFEDAVTEKTGLTAADLYTYSDDNMSASLAMTGIFRTAQKDLVVYRGLNLSAVIFDYESATLTEMYEETHFYKNVADVKNRETYVFDYAEKTIEKLQKNEKGEVISDNILFDYQGNDIVYKVPQGITKIAGGAGLANDSMRFVLAGDDVTETGPFAFAFCELFGIVFGENITDIGEYSFFGYSYLDQIIFNGSNIPTIGTAAFCTITGTQGIGPAILCTDYSVYADCRIYTPLSTGGWFGDPAVAPFVDAMNASLEDLGELLPSINGEPALYTKDNFSQIETYASYFYASGKTVELPCGTLSMLGTSGSGAYAIIEYNEESGQNGLSIVYYSCLPGYSAYESTAPRDFECSFRTELGFDSFHIYGYVNGDGQFVVRGDEAGSYGEVGKDIFKFDGFGKFSYFGEDGTTVDGEYTVDNGVIAFDALNKTAVFDKTANTLTYDSKVLGALGSGAGIYYDLNNAAKLTVDGKAYVDNDERYSGKITLEYNGRTHVIGYKLSGSTMTVVLNGMERKWDYSTKADADYVFKGYYGPGETEMQLKFIVIENTVMDTFTNGDETLTLDGYFFATVKNADEEKQGVYRRFGESNSYLVTVDGVEKIARINFEDKTYTYASAPELGKWYISTSANYSWYFDGNGNFLYNTGDDFKYGTYTFDAATGIMDIVYEGNPAANNEKSRIDLAIGKGTLVYNTGYSNSSASISRTEFTSWGSAIGMYPSAPTVTVGTGDDAITVKPWFTMYKSDKTVFINTYGNPIAVVTLDEAIGNGTTFTFDYTLKSGDDKVQATYQVTMTVAEGVYTVTVTYVDGTAQIVQ